MKKANYFLIKKFNLFMMSIFIPHLVNVIDLIAKVFCNFKSFKLNI